jgi:hypothetical protein
MRDLLFRLMTLGLPALLLVVAVMAWSGGAQAGEAMARHHDGALAADHAMPCHEQAPPAAAPQKADRGCPDCRCLFAGCASAAALPGQMEAAPIAYTLAPPLASAPARLVTQALSHPPAEPPRL